jgi:hypothetical protein
MIEKTGNIDVLNSWTQGNKVMFLIPRFGEK